MNEEEKKGMGLRIRECRVSKGLSQDGLADLLGMKRTNIANYEAGRVVPPGSVVLTLSEIFGVTTDYILGRSNDPSVSLDSNIAELQRLRKSLPNNRERKRMDKMLENVKLSFLDAFNEEEEDDEDDRDL